MSSDDAESSKPNTRTRSDVQNRNNRKRATESKVDTTSTQKDYKDKGKKLKKNNKEVTKEEEKMGNMLSRWLGWAPKNEYRDPDWRQKMNERAEEEAKWEREEKERILRAKALRQDHDVSDTEDDMTDEGSPPPTLIQQRERDEDRASRQKERYDIRKYRLKFNAEDRIQITDTEKSKLEFKTKCRENEEGEWDFTLLPEFREAYEKLILSKRGEDGEEEIAKRKARFSEEQRMREIFQQHKAEQAQTRQTVVELPDVLCVITDEVSGRAQGRAANGHVPSKQTNSEHAGPSGSSGNPSGTGGNLINLMDSVSENAAHDMSPSANDMSPSGNDMSPSPQSADTPDFEQVAETYGSQSPPIYRQPSVNSQPAEPDSENTRFMNKKDRKKKSKKEQQELDRKMERIEKKKKLKIVSRWSIEDTREYREGYVGKLEIPDIVENKEFYFNERPSIPDGGYIEEILTDWRGNFSRLESHHGYIQWLFPIREKGMNFQSYELQPHEARAIMADEDASGRIVRAYEMMLDFYGMKLVDRKTGAIERDDHWQSRFNHLNKSFHNYLRITRILKCLGELGYEHYKVPFMDFMLYESLVTETLANCARSCMEYWLHTVRDNTQRSKLIMKANKMIDDTTDQATQQLSLL